MEGGECSCVMNRRRVMNACVNSPLPEKCLQTVAIAVLYADYVQVIDAGESIAHARSYDAWDIRKQPVVSVRVAAAAFVASDKSLQLQGQYGGLDRVEPAIEANDPMVVLMNPAMVPE